MIGLAKTKTLKLSAVFLLALLVLQFVPGLVQAALYDPKDLTFTITTDHNFYRTYVGGSAIVIKATVSQSNNPPVVVGDEIDRTAKPNPDIAGFYAAVVGKGASDLCGFTGCNFESHSGNSFTNSRSEEPLPVTFNIPIDTEENQPDEEETVKTRELWVFPVLDLSTDWTHEPFTNNPATVTIAVYSNQEVFNAAAAAANIDPGNFLSQCAGVTATTGGAEKGIFGGRVADFLGGSLLSLVNAILTVIVGILRVVIWLLATYIILPLLEVTLSMDAANIASAIQFGWTIVRDLVNMLFILVLIILGFATILRIESYNYRHILVELIIMAVLVNFSLVIARIIIQIADLVQFAFLPQGEGMAGVRYLFQVLINDQTKEAINGLSFTTSGALAATASILFQFILELGVIITFGALAVYTLIRIVALWILMILSPFAYALRILPATHHQAEEWWHNFLKYAFFTPIIAFFLRLTIELHSRGLAITQGSSFGSKNISGDIQTHLAQVSSSGEVPLKASLELIIIYVVVLAFMWAGIIVANKLGIYGADMVTDFAKKGIAAPFVLGKRALVGKHAMEEFGGLAGFAERGIAGKAFENARAAERAGQYNRARFWKGVGMVLPSVRRKAWGHYKEKQEKKTVGRAAAQATDTLYRIMPSQWRIKSAHERAAERGRGQIFTSMNPLKGKETHEGTIEERNYINEIAKHHRSAALTAEDVAEQFEKALESGDKIEIAATFQNLVLGRNADDYAGLQTVQHEPEFVNGYTPEAFDRHIERKFREAGFTPDESAYYVGISQELAEGDNKLREIGATVTDPDNRKRLVADLTWFDQNAGTADFNGIMNAASEAYRSTAVDMRRNIQLLRQHQQTLAPNSQEYQILGQQIQAAENRAQRYENYDNDFQASINQGVLQANVRDALVAFRKNRETIRRVLRMAPVQVASNLETALVREQLPNGTYGEMSDFGALFIHSLPPPVQGALEVRAFQAMPRELRMSGIGVQSSGSMVLPEQSSVADLETGGIFAALNPTVAAIHRAKVQGQDVRGAVNNLRGGNYDIFTPVP